MEVETETEIEIVEAEVVSSEPSITNVWLQWLGVLIVVALAVVPDLMRALDSLNVTEPRFVTMKQLGFGLIYRSAYVCIVLFVVLMITKTACPSIGLVSIQSSDLGWGILIWLAGTVSFYIADFGLSFVEFSPTNFFASFEPPSTREHFLWIFAGSLANGFAEEVILRGFLLTRFEKLLRSTTLAVVLTSVMFASYHIYQGVGPMISIFGLGLVYGCAFCWIRRIWPLAIAHAIADFVGLAALAHQ
jgi:membrane protease YdiL (CAAX protease family)